LRELNQTFDSQPTIQTLLEDAAMLVWSVLEREEKS
jgi:hypothetical protein